MSKKRSRRQHNEIQAQQQTRRQRWNVSLILIGSVVLFLVIGYNAHANCAQNCQNQPVYFYGVPIPGAHYSQFYNTDNNGHSLDNSSGDENNGSHSSSGSNDDEGGYHGGGAPEVEP